MRIRLDIVHPMPSPYREQLFATLAQHPQLSIKVYQAAPTMHRGHRWSFEKREYTEEVLSRSGSGRGYLQWPRIVPRMLSDRPDVVAVWGWSYLTANLATVLGRMLRIPVLLFSANALPAFEPTKGAAAVPARLIRRLSVNLATGFIVPGRLAAEYLQQSGIGSKRIHTVNINCLDAEAWRRKSEDARRRLCEVKERFHLSEEHTISFVGRLVPGKGLFTLLDAYKLLRRERDDIGLLIVGDGPDRESLTNLARSGGLSGVHILGPVPHDELPWVYGISSVFVLPTFSDQWPLVVLEALACGVPVVTTLRCGSIIDLIDGRGTGIVVEPGDSASLAEAVQYVLSLRPDELAEKRKAAWATAANYDYRIATAQFADAVLSYFA